MGGRHSEHRISRFPRAVAFDGKKFLCLSRKENRTERREATTTNNNNNITLPTRYYCGVIIGNVLQLLGKLLVFTHEERKEETFLHQTHNKLPVD